MFPPFLFSFFFSSFLISSPRADRFPKLLAGRLAQQLPPRRRRSGGEKHLYLNSPKKTQQQQQPEKQQQLVRMSELPILGLFFFFSISCCYFWGEIYIFHRWVHHSLA
jgi:hypothetical protein